MSPPPPPPADVVTESSGGQPEQPTAAATIAEELEKKLQVSDDFTFLCHGFCFLVSPSRVFFQTDEPIVEDVKDDDDDDDDDDDEEEEDGDAQGDSSLFSQICTFQFP